jgi:hypothetical protein
VVRQVMLRLQPLVSQGRVRVIGGLRCILIGRISRRHTDSSARTSGIETLARFKCHCGGRWTLGQCTNSLASQYMQATSSLTYVHIHMCGANYGDCQGCRPEDQPNSWLSDTSSMASCPSPLMPKV